MDRIELTEADTAKMGDAEIAMYSAALSISAVPEDLEIKNALYTEACRRLAERIKARRDGR